MPDPSLSRVWAAVMHDGQPRCIVEDIPTKEIRWHDAEYRWFRLHALDYGEPDGEDDGCAGGSRCVPGAPCPACQVAAVSWWYEWAKREATRYWRSTCSVEGSNRSSTDDWCKHKHADNEDASKCARRKRFPFVVELDGHGRQLQRIAAGAARGGQLALGFPHV